MRVVRLVTGKDWGFVARVEIVPFPDDGMPGVIMWGDRMFTCADFTGAEAQRRQAGAEWTYVEAFAFVSVTPSPGMPDETKGDAS